MRSHVCEASAIGCSCCLVNGLYQVADRQPCVRLAVMVFSWCILNYCACQMAQPLLLLLFNSLVYVH